MKWLKNIRGGSYIVESAIVMPIFILAVVLLMSIVPIIAGCENVTFAAADEMHMECAKTAFRKNPAAMPLLLKARVQEENRELTAYRTEFYRYCYTKGELEDLITIDFHAVFDKKNPFGFFSNVDFEGRVTARAFTGRLLREEPAPRKEFEEEKVSCIVYIFPEWGKRYHSKNCSYIKANCQLTTLSQELKRKYEPCHLCNAADAQVGSSVFCFFTSGEAYHVAGCRVIDRYYIEIEKEEAESKGYTPCSKCGGGGN